MKKLLILFLIFILIQPLFSQTREEMLLMQSYRQQNLQIYTWISQTGSRDQIIDMLGQLDEEYTELGYSKADPQLLDMLVFLSGQGSVHRSYKYNRLDNNYPRIRTLATRLLGKTGGDTARFALIENLKAEDNINVAAEICTQLSVLGDNSQQFVTESLIYFFHNHFITDEKFVFAYVDALHAALQSGNRPDPYAVRILLSIQSRGYSKAVSDKAYAAVMSLKRK